MNQKLESKRNPILAFIIIFLGGLFVLYQFLLQGSTSLMIPQLMHDLCINLAQIGFLSAGFFYPYVLLQIPAGILADKYGAKRVLVVSTLLLALATLWFALSGSMLTAESSRIFMGVASAPGVACAMCLGAKWYPKKFALVAGMFEMMGMIGGALGDYLLSESIGKYGASMTMVFCAIAGFALMVLIIVFVKNSPNNKYLNQDKDLETFEKEETYNFWAILRNVQIWQYCLYGAFMFGIISAFATLWAIPFIEALYPAHDNWAAHAVALVFVGAAAGAISSGYLVTKIGRIKMIMLFYAILGVVSFFIVLYVSLPGPIMMIFLFLSGLASGSYVLAFDCVKCAVPESAQGMAMGLTNMVIMLIGAPLFQPLIGWLLDYIGHSSDEMVCQANTIESFQVALLPIMLGLIIAVGISLSVKVKHK